MLFNVVAVEVLPMFANLALTYGLMSFTLYSAGFSDKKLDSLARILACGTVACLSLGQLAG